MLFPQSDLLAEEAFAWVARHATLEREPQIVNPSHKWRIRSCFQKSVRRGNADRAVEMGLRLHRLDARYAWRAVLTVATEDVGIGAPETVLWATAGQRVGFQKAVGELPLFIALIRRMATTTKSRSAIELAFVVDTGEPAIFRLLAKMTTDQLLDRFAGADLYEAYAAVSVLRGIVPKGSRIRAPDRPGVMAACEMLIDQMAPASERAARSALLSPLDEMSMGFAVAARLHHTDDERYDVTPDTVMIDGYPAETYDQHERLGRQAIGQFSRRLAESLPALARLSPAGAKAAVGDAAFVIEGQCLDRWVSGPDLDRLRDEADRFSLTRHGLSSEESFDFCQLVIDRLCELHTLREGVVRLAGAD